MENSFYYFFSSAPQVLSGILALFGVFVIFKIQSLKENLLGSGQEILDEFERRPDIQNTVQKSNEYLVFRLKKAIHKHDIYLLKTHIKDIIAIVNTPSFKQLEEIYNQKLIFLNLLVKNTIISSIITAILIVICLTILPFGKILLNNACILFLVFATILLCISYCIFTLVRILIKSLKE
jgi:hypothetical protein